MPIQIIMTEGTVSKETAQKMHHEVAELFLETHGIAGNSFMRPNVIGEVLFVEQGLTFTDQQAKDIAIVELRAPSFTFATQEQKSQFVERATAIVLNATNGALPQENIWVNAVYAVDGIWGIGGKAFTNEQLGEAIAEAASAAAA